MLSIVLNIVLVALATAIGAGVGWWFRDGGSGTASDAELESLRNQLEEATQEVKATKKKTVAALREAESAREDAEAARSDAEHAKDALAKLQGLAQSMAADVTEHNTRVQAINEELEAEEGTDNVVATVAKLIETNQNMQRQLETAESRLADQAKELETHVLAARTDALTKLGNRRAFDDEMAKCQLAYERAGRPSCVMMMDVDYFKKFNDTHGHQAGDEVLRGVARVLTGETGPQEIVCRYGGEEFAIIFPGVGLEESMAIAERARTAIGEASFEFEGIELRVTASGGLAQFQKKESAELLVKRADEALYACKKAGRDCGHWHDGSTSHAIEKRPPEESTADPANEGRKDRLTGLPLKESFDDDTQRRLAEWRRGGEPMCVVMLEIDKFDAILNQNGPEGGDTILRASAQFLRATMRDMDHVARYGDCRFTMLLPGASQPDGMNVAERLRQAIGNCKLPGHSGLLQFTVSLGVAECVQNDTSTKLIERAGLAMKSAGQQGGNQVVAASELVAQA